MSPWSLEAPAGPSDELEDLGGQGGPLFERHSDVPSGRTRELWSQVGFGRRGQ